MLGWIGTGVMGRWMCGHLMAAGHRMVVYNRTRAKAQPLLDAGAQWRDTPATVTAAADVVFTMVGFPADVEAVYFGDAGIMQTLSAGKTVVDMTTTRPSLAQRIASCCQAVGAHALDAPVSGGDIGAREARLAIMVGGERPVFDSLQPLFSLMGKHIIHEGEAGAGQHTKMANQITIAGTMIGVCEALVYARHAGLDLDTLIGTISKGAAGCWSLENLAPRIVRGDFAPGFYVNHFIKDLGIALDEAARLELELPGLRLAHRLYQDVQSAGEGTCGTQALIHAIERCGARRRGPEGGGQA